VPARPYPRGIRRTATGWQVYARRDGAFLSAVFPLSTPIDTLKREREKMIGRALEPTAYPPTTGRRFADDAQEYLHLVRGMPSYAEREYHIRRWVQVFGDRDRATIQARDIARVLETWRLTGAADGGPLSNGSLNRRRTALMSLWTRLDGRQAPNPVKGTPLFSEHESERVRAIPMLDLARVLRHLQPTGKSRARLRVMQWTGLPHALIKSLTPADIDWTHGRIRLARRQKGAGMAAAWVPVLPRGMAALRHFARLGCFGTFDNAGLYHAFARAVEADNQRRRTRGLPELPAIHPYVARHSFATWAAGIVKDDRALKELLRTNSIRRYTEGATASRLDAARDALAAALRHRATLQLLPPLSPPSSPLVRAKSRREPSSKTGENRRKT
jgi:integrase